MIRALAGLGFVLIVAVLAAGCREPLDVEVTAAQVREADEKKADMPPADRIYPFGHPIQWDALVSQRGAGEQWRHRFYVKGER